MAKIRDDNLFRQPKRSNYGECPICCLPLPLDVDKYVITACCCKIICKSCNYATQLREWEEGLEHKCPFCREPGPKDDEEIDRRIMKRIEANDPAAMADRGLYCYDEGDYDAAIEYFTKAAELGDAEAHCRLGLMYMEGEGEIVEKDYGLAMYHWEKAAIGGHPNARSYLASIERKNGNAKRAAKHLVIAANLGDEKSMKVLWKCYSAGCIAKEELEATLRTHQAAIDAMRSKERDAAEAILRRNTASR